MAKPCILLPKQLLYKIKFFKIHEELGNCLDQIEQKIIRAEQDMMAAGDTYAVAEYAVAHVGSYRSFNEEIETARKHGIQQWRRTRKKTSEVPRVATHPVQETKSKNTLLSSPLPTAQQTSRVPHVATHLAQEAKPKNSLLSKPRSKARCIAMPNDPWWINTHFDDVRLERYVNENMDSGTFKTPLLSAAYHLTKHAPEQLTEEYISQAQNVFENNWFGELAVRVERSHRGATASSQEQQNYIKIVRSAAGFGGFSWDGKVIWFDSKNTSHRRI